MRHSSAQRTGQSSVIALIALPLLLGVLLLVLVLFRTRDSLIELRNAGVAASLAGCEDLVDDDLLCDQADRIRPVLDRAGRSAAEVAHRNLVGGRRLELLPNDVTFGTLDRAVGGQFTRFDSHAMNAHWGQVNAVEVTVRQPGKPDVFTRVTAVLDRAVIGFKPWDEKPAPVVPVALFADRDNDHAGWNDECRSNRDRFLFDRDEKRFKPGNDGRPEIRVRVGRQPNGRSDDVCGFPLIIGSGGTTAAIEQVRSGLTTNTLAGPAFNGEFKLPEENAHPHGGSPDLFDGGPDDEAERAFQALVAVGEPRVWPLFSRFDDHGRAILTGFTAARVVAVERERGTRGLVLTLQPAVLATPTAVTDPGRCDRQGRPIGDRTVVKVRLAG